MFCKQRDKDGGQRQIAERNPLERSARRPRRGQFLREQCRESQSPGLRGKRNGLFAALIIPSLELVHAIRSVCRSADSFFLFSESLVSASLQSICVCANPSFLSFLLCTLGELCALSVNCSPSAQRSKGQPLSCAIRASLRDGFTAIGLPTHASTASSLALSPYA